MVFTPQPPSSFSVKTGLMLHFFPPRNSLLLHASSLNLFLLPFYPSCPVSPPPPQVRDWFCSLIPTHILFPYQLPFSSFYGSPFCGPSFFFVSFPLFPLVLFNYFLQRPYFKFPFLLFQSSRLFSQHFPFLLHPLFSVFAAGLIPSTPPLTLPHAQSFSSRHSGFPFNISLGNSPYPFPVRISSLPFFLPSSFFCHSPATFFSSTLPF